MILFSKIKQKRVLMIGRDNDEFFEEFDNSLERGTICTAFFKDSATSVVTGKPQFIDDDVLVKDAVIFKDGLPSKNLIGLILT